MSIELENQVWQLRVAVEKLSARVSELEKTSKQIFPPLGKRVKRYLAAENNNLCGARDRAKAEGDTEALKEIMKLIDRSD